jgi:hypothetical protein
MNRDNSSTHDPWEEPRRETSYEAFLRLKRLKQRARQAKPNNTEKDTSQTNTRPRSQARPPATSKDMNTTGPRRQSLQPGQRPLPSKYPSERNNGTDIPSRRYRSPSRASEMYAEDTYDEDIYDTDVPPTLSRQYPRPRQEYPDDSFATPSRHAQRSRFTRGHSREPIDRARGCPLRAGRKEKEV